MSKRLILTLALLMCFFFRVSGSGIENKLPYPERVELKCGSFAYPGCQVGFGREVVEITGPGFIRDFSDLLSQAGRRKCKARPFRDVRRGIAFVVDETIRPEGYVLDISPREVRIEASSRAGFFYAVQTISQLLLPSCEGAPAPRTLPCCRIEDGPRFGYRGLMIDCSRHFFSVEVLKKHLKMMAFYKMNRFHWHLTDDQGWRLEIKKYPALTEVGSRREGTQVGKKRNTCDGIPYGGFYTQEQVRDIVQYADSLCISIVPEIDFPGHFLAALASYPELGCSGSAPYKVGTGWGISRQVMNPGKESAVRFIEDVLAEVSELFPGE
ncbi:MAG: family 20 glycosylhydrolase, partial [Bacteroidales bacterium]|nr:family 20 glycosylhydrolase [Bacteroidales bacterium]